MFVATFDQAVLRLEIYGLSSSASWGFVETAADEPLDGFEEYIVPVVGGVDLGWLHYADISFVGRHHRTIYIGSPDSFFPTQLIAHTTPAPAGTLVAFAVAVLVVVARLGRDRNR
jgi:hypothetical protein